jgi:hypothetical protein
MGHTVFFRQVEITKNAFPRIWTISMEVGAAHQQSMTIAPQGGQYVSLHTEAITEKLYCLLAEIKLWKSAGRLILHHARKEILEAV